jgi:hypothetical protein
LKKGAVVVVVEVVLNRLFLETNPVVGLIIVQAVNREAVTPKRESVRIHNPIAARDVEILGLLEVRANSGPTVAKKGRLVTWYDFYIRTLFLCSTYYNRQSPGF